MGDPDAGTVLFHYNHVMWVAGDCHVTAPTVALAFAFCLLFMIDLPLAGRERGRGRPCVCGGVFGANLVQLPEIMAGDGAL